MKRLTQTLVRATGWACALLLLSCQKQDEGVPVEQQVQFSFHYTAPSDLAGRTEDDLAEAAFVVVTVNDAAHQPVQTGKKLSLINVNGKFVSEPLSLLPGNYLLSDFVVLNQWGAVLFASPHKHSGMANLVVAPLDFSLPVGKGKVFEFVPEVLSVGDHRAEDFGYATFNFPHVKTFNFHIAVSVCDTVEDKCTEAMVSIFSKSHGLLLQRSIHAEITRLTLPDYEDNFTIRVEKKGYSTYQESFSATELKQYLKGTEKGPLHVTLCKGHLVFWNTLGSDTEVLNSRVGPDLSFYTGGDGLNSPANHEYAPAKKGNGITIAPGTYFVGQRLHNVVMTDPGTVINPERGAIVCYFRQNQSPVAYSNNPYRIFDGPYGLDCGLGFVSYDYIGDGLSDALWFELTLGGTTAIISSTNFNVYNGQWLRVAAVWDRAGINGTNETMRIYINGEKAAAGQDTGWGTLFGAQADIAGGNDQNIAGKFYVDELKIYDYAKTDY